MFPKQITRVHRTGGVLVPPAAVPLSCPAFTQALTLQPPAAWLAPCVPCGAGALSQGPSWHPELQPVPWVPARLPWCRLVVKLTAWQWAYLLIATEGPPPPPPAGSQAPKCPNRLIFCPEHVSQGPLSPKNVPRCEFPWEGTGLARKLLGPLPFAFSVAGGGEAGHLEVCCGGLGLPGRVLRRFGCP